MVAKPSPWPKHRGVCQSHLHQLQAHQPIIDMPKLDSSELDHVNFDPFRGAIIG